MLYNDLDKIPLDIFIDVFLGEKRKLIIDGNHSEEELESQASMLISEYIEIVGGASVSSEILKKSNLINLHIKVECMRIAELMANRGEWDEVINILRSFGYQLFPSEHEKIRKRISAIMSQSRYLIESYNSKKAEEQSSKMDKNYFAR